MSFINTLSYDFIQRGHNGTALIVLTDKSGQLVPLNDDKAFVKASKMVDLILKEVQA